MSNKKKIIILIIIFILGGILILGVYLLNKKDVTSTSNTTPWYQDFNPFGSGKKIINNNNNTNTNIDNNINQNPEIPTDITSKFSKITDFAIAGATFLEDIRPISDASGNITKTEQVKTLISADTKEGRKEIQTILNNSLSLNPALVVDGNFGKLAIQAIKDFQKINNLPITGKVDSSTAPYFTKIVEQEQVTLDEKAPSIRYVERKNGHIYKMFLDTKTKEKISNSTIPSIYEAFFDKSGNTVIYRYLSEDGIINSFMATLGALKGEFLPQNVSNVSVSPDKTRFFYLAENSNGVTGTIGIFGETKKDMVFNYPFTEWLSTWDNNQKVYLTTKPSYGINGSIFLLNSTSETISKVFGGVPGLTTLINPDGSLILYGSSENSGPRLGVFNIQNRSVKDFGYGLPEKCVWSDDKINIYCAMPNVIKGNEFPDLWYQGLISFDDYFVKINTTTGDMTTIANSINETPIDATYLFLDNTEDTLFFTNKKDSTLWSLNLK